MQMPEELARPLEGLEQDPLWAHLLQWVGLLEAQHNQACLIPSEEPTRAIAQLSRAVGFRILADQVRLIPQNAKEVMKRVRSREALGNIRPFRAN